MQKISSYLYPNRLTVLADVNSSPLEWKIVYQRKVKIYHGMNNVIEFDIKNADQKRVDITDFTIEMVAMDEQGKEIFTVPVTPSATLQGLATATITADDLGDLAPQFLKYSLYIVESATAKSPLYADAQFGMLGTLEVISGAVPIVSKPKVIDTFNYIHNLIDKIDTYTSDAVEVRPFNTYKQNGVISLNFKNKDLDGDVWVQTSNNGVVSNGTVWDDLDTFTITSTTSTLTKTYAEVTNFQPDVVWLRIKYVPTEDTSGNLDKVLVTV